MGCSTSKLDEEEVVQLCKDRRNFIKQAVEHRMRFALGHIAYIQSLKRVSAALSDYVGGDGDEAAMLMLDSAYITPPPFAKSIQPKSFSVPAPRRISQLGSSSVRIDFYRPRGKNPSVLVEERVGSPETVRVESYSPVHQYGGGRYEGFFQAQPSSSTFFCSPPNERRNMPPPSPQASQWDFFWNPFASLDYDYYNPGGSYDDDPRVFDDDDASGLRRVREEEGIPELEEESENEVIPSNASKREGYREEVLVEDVDDEDSDEGDTDEEGRCVYDEEEEEEEEDHEDDYLSESEVETEHELQETHLQPRAAKSKEISEARDIRGQVKISQERAKGREIETTKEEKPAGFTVYVNRRPTSMWEVVRDLEEQFIAICNAADEVACTLDTSRAQYSSSSSSDLTAMKILNPVALLRSASSRSTSSRYLTNTSASREDGNGSSRHFSEESSIFVGHQSTLDRLYAWEKKLYEEVRTGERLRMTYEKKCALLRKQDFKGEDDNVMDKTRAIMRNLHTQIKVSMHSVEAISLRIRTLMIEELQPQVHKLVQGLSKMWKVMAECHQLQKRTLDEAKLLLAAGTSSRNYKAITTSALKLESELLNWRNCFESWIISQRSYAKSLAGWVLRCLRCDAESFAKAPFSPRRSAGVPPIFGICIQWSKLLDSIPEVKVIDGLEFFAAGVGSIYAQHIREESRRMSSGSRRFPHGSGGMLEVGFVEDDDDVFMSPQKMAELSMKVLCAGMSVAVSSLKEFSVSSSEGYSVLVKQSENVKDDQRVIQGCLS